jgi:hypothetical protein
MKKEAVNFDFKNLFAEEIIKVFKAIVPQIVDKRLQSAKRACLRSQEKNYSFQVSLRQITSVQTQQVHPFVETKFPFKKQLIK